MYYSHYWVISNSWTIVDTFCKATRIPWLCSLCIYRYLDHVQCVWLGWTLIKTIYNRIHPQICTQENWIKINQLYCHYLKMFCFPRLFKHILAPHSIYHSSIKCLIYHQQTFAIHASTIIKPLDCNQKHSLLLERYSYLRHFDSQSLSIMDVG